MPSISRIKIKHFKKASEMDFAIGDVTVLVGGNNSGKSSSIQGLHFAVTLLQSLELANRWPRADQNTTVFPEELIFSPADDPYRLYDEGPLQQGKHIEFELTLDDGRLVSIDLTKGRNANLSARVNPIPTAKELSSLVNPFSIYSPGLAGIARREQYVSNGVLLRAVSRGDANLFLRNILYRLSGNEGWDAFLRDIQTLFGDANMLVNFDDNSDESILVTCNFGDRSVPLESCGTGLLQAIQILSYVHYFRPSVIILDEPDSHLHPNNQRILCELLVYISEEYNSKVILTTHSRHVIDCLEQNANFVWVQNGRARQATPEDRLDVLMDLGALDIREVAQVNRQFFILTEDKNKRNLEDLLLSNGFANDSFAVYSYYGIIEPHKLQVVIDIIRELQPHASVIVHRDRDFLIQDEVDTWNQRVRAMDASPFVTASTDVEDYFVNPDYLAEKNANLTALDAAAIIEQAIAELVPKAIENYTNGRLDVLRKAGNRDINNGAVAAHAAQIVDQSPRSAIKGKMLRASVRRIFREQRGLNLNTAGTSAFLEDEMLQQLAPN